MMNDPVTMNDAAVRAAKPVAESARKNGTEALRAVFGDDTAFDRMAAAYIRATKRPQ